MSAGYDAALAAWRDDPDGYWRKAAAAIDWDVPPDRILDDGNPPFSRWFPDARLNTCHNALDRHVAAGRGEQPALIYDSAMLGAVETFSYRALRDRVARIAGMIRAQGVEPGDRVIVYMPMVPEAVMAMLACARIGAVHSVVFGGFAARELAVRIDDAKPKLVLTASCGLEPGRVVPYKPLLDHAIDLAKHKPDRCILLQREACRAEMTAPRDRDWQEAEAAAEPVGCVSVAATDPLYILYTSGTTGTPKGVVRDHGGHAVALAWSMPKIYGAAPGEVYWAASDIGWVVGHSYIVYAPLLTGCTTVLYEGKPVGTPDAGAFWRVVEQHKVRTLFSAPTAFRAIKRDDPQGALAKAYDISSLRSVFMAGERADPDTVDWTGNTTGVPVIDHWWQTETGWPIAANCLGLGLDPVKPGSCTKPVPGFDVQILDEGAKPLPAGKTGAIAVKLPLPPGCLPTLWGNDARFIAGYLKEYPGYYQSGDAGHIDEDGYLHVMSRTDDIINVAGHRLSTGEIEQALTGHPDIAEAAVIGVKDAIKGTVPLGLAVKKAGVTAADADLAAELVARVREEVGPVASFKTCLIVARLPKTRSGKTLRGTMRALADAEPYSMPATIDDPAILSEIEEALRQVGLAKP